jgi:HK97 family phage prohead protease
MTRTFTTKVNATPSGDGLFTFVGSTPKVDRAGDSIKPVWDLEAYRRNPVFLYQHDHDALPIGRAENVYLDGDALKFDIRFVPGDIYPHAETVRRMYEEGFMSAVSVGFRPLASSLNDSGGVDFAASELLELSAVSVPCNADALLMGKGNVRPVFKDKIPASMDNVDVAKVKAWLDAPISAPPAKAPETPAAAPVVEQKTVATESHPEAAAPAPVADPPADNAEPDYHDGVDMEATPETLVDMLGEAAYGIVEGEKETATRAIGYAIAIVEKLFPDAFAKSAGTTQTKSAAPEQGTRPAGKDADATSPDDDVELTEEEIDEMVRKVIGEKA